MDRSRIPAQSFYRLTHGIFVRKEKFGLLFYNSKGPKLTFVHSGPWIDLELFSKKIHLKEWVREEMPTISEEKLLELEQSLLCTLKKLVEKGLIVETMADS